MSDDLSPADRLLLAELESLLRRCDPVPDAVYAAAEAVFALVSLEDRLELITDGTLVRSATRTFRFQGKEIRIEVRLCRLPWGIRLDGLVSPRCELEVRWPAGSRQCPPNDAGYFRADDLPNQPLRIQIGSLVTPWFWP
jgi:hypothetical protein